MNILVTLDSNYVAPLCTMLETLLAVHPRLAMRIFVAHSSLTERDFNVIRRACSGHPVKVVPVFLKDSFFENAPRCGRITKETYYRLFAPIYLPQDVERVLYIDPDTIILNDLSSFYHLDFGTALFAGAGHLGRLLTNINRTRLHMKKTKTYLNAGVLLINIAALRASFNTADIYAFIRKNERILWQADQDVINGLYDGKIIALNGNIVNMDERLFSHLLASCGVDLNLALSIVEKKTMIVHFDGKHKPWNPNYRGYLNRYYPYEVYKRALTVRAGVVL